MSARIPSYCGCLGVGGRHSDDRVRVILSVQQKDKPPQQVAGVLLRKQQPLSFPPKEDGMAFRSGYPPFHYIY